MNPKKLNDNFLEKTITSLLAQKKEEGVKLAYHAYGSALYGIILKILNNKELASETLQDVFLKVWKNGHTYDPTKGRLFTWLANIARNTAIDRTRTARFKQDAKTETYDPLVFKNEALSEEMQIRDSGLAKVIEAMEDHHRLLIDLIYFQGYTQKEAAEATETPLGTIKSRIRAAIKVLRKRLNDLDLLHES
ncbi:MAG: sigma-70 family RNA polymerase sigma factor [Bacteroidota bacterium]